MKTINSEAQLYGWAVRRTDLGAQAKWDFDPNELFRDKECFNRQLLRKEIVLGRKISWPLKKHLWKSIGQDFFRRDEKRQ